MASRVVRVNSCASWLGSAGGTGLTLPADTREGRRTAVKSWGRIVSSVRVGSSRGSDVKNRPGPSAPRGLRRRKESTVLP
ncbi:hypothetical protein LX32DRAFT_155322 [Colletotrichum zoysiae]|uniref:Uncharacterized protein n=1 Tax=Colletotrichum zoysiae TaxID=1216348 RepID=A0AAD9M5Q1_9PEZI|nr:hypothetical protein LX32DRAFT_155322 [Colletotrichum zoysiae]